MSKKLHTLCKATIICFALFLTGSLSAQITYSEDFEAVDHGWSDDDFEDNAGAPCNGLSSIRGNAFEFIGFSIPAETVSPSLGTANGSAIVLSYSYKLLNYASGVPTVATQNSSNWGTITVEYGATATGPWTLIETITPQNHIESTACAVRSSGLTPPAGTEVYLRILATPGSGADFFMYLDDVSVTAATACTGTPAATTVNPVANAVCTNESFTLSLASSYTASGITIQWQSSTDNVTFSNVPTGGTGTTYTGTIAASTWYRAVITCSANPTAFTTPAVQVISTGLPCYCEVTFEDGVEAISGVSFGGLNNTSDPDDTANAVEDFTGVSAPAFLRGTTYPVALEGNTADPDAEGYEDYFTIYIDWNHDGDLTDDGEEFQIGVIEGSTGSDGIQATGSITIPATALLGNTYMRVVKNYDGYADSPCYATSVNAYFYGQVEDYLINVQAAAGTGSFDAKSFTYYPNPVKDMFTVSYTGDISGIEVYNLLGQQVLAKTINAATAQIDMSALAPGTYVVKATAGNAVQAIKVVKQ